MRSILLLKDVSDEGTIGRATASLDLEDREIEDLARYLDVTRAEMLFARGVILVEGDAERFLVPEFAKMVDTPLDPLGITVCSVAGFNFQPYAKLLTGLGIPFAIVTDWDPRGENGHPLGYNRMLKLVRTIEETRTGENQDALIGQLDGTETYEDFRERCEEYGISSETTTRWN